MFEIALKSAEKGGKDVAFLILCHFQRDGIQGGCRRPDGDDGNGADQEEEIQNKQVGYSG